MKRKMFSAVTLTLLLASMLTLAFNIQPVKSDPKTWYVDDDGGADFTKIQDAIYAASPGDTIYVYNGTYYENIVVDKTVLLIGEDRNITIIDGKKSGSVLHVTADTVHIIGFTIQNSGEGLFYGNGVFLDYSHGNIIKNNIIQHNELGINIWNSNGNTLNGNILRFNGVLVWYSIANTIVDNFIYHGSIGLVQSGGNTFRNNAMDQFSVSGWSLADYINDVDTSNIIRGKPIYYWVNQHNKQVPADAGVVVVVNSTGIVVKDLRLVNIGDGMIFAYTSNSFITNIDSNGASYGIRLDFSNNNTVNNNKVSGNMLGIFLSHSENNSISGNTASYNSWAGILLQNSDENNISTNVMHYNARHGIFLEGSGNNTIIQNTITYNGFRMRDYYPAGICFSNSRDNSIHHNNFIDNLVQVSDIPGEAITSVNIWDNGYPSGGNYWSDYNGTDFYSGPFQNETDSDGIGDSPYIIDENNTDRYPLIHSYGFVPFVPSPRTPQFWLLAIEKMRAYDIRDGQFLISELLKYPNWNNSTEYTAYIHLLSEYTSEEVDDPIRPYLCGYPSRSNVELEIKNFLAQASSGDIVIFYIVCHGGYGYLYNPYIYYSELANWLSAGGLQHAFVTVILETCSSGSSIKNGEGGVLGPNRNVLCACMSNEGGSGLCGMWQGFSHFITEGFALCEDCDNDGWASATEVFEYAKPLTEDWIEATFGWGQHPVSYYGQVEGNVPLVQRDVTKPFPDIMPPTITLLSPQNVTYTTTSTPLTFTVDEETSWIGYSLDNQANITITENTTLTGLSEGTHHITVYANDSSGNMGASETVYFTIALPYGPKAEFTILPETAKVGELVKFDASSSLSGWNGTHNMSITEYRWDFGDGNRTTTSTPIVYHRFSSSGIYYVTLTVYAPGATPETDSTTHRVTVITIPVGGYSISIQVTTKAEPVLPYIALIATLTAILTKLRPKTKRKH